LLLERVKGITMIAGPVFEVGTSWTLECWSPLPYLY
jgi:hypothetical protein